LSNLANAAIPLLSGLADFGRNLFINVEGLFNAID